MVSITVPVYNIESYLPRCVKSLLGQTCPDLEIILVDDGSTDGSRALCDEYAQMDPRIRVIHKENGGLSSARNAGIDAATGEWLLFVDGDDYLAGDALEQLLPFLAPEVDFVQFHYQETDGTWLPAAQIPNPQVCTDPREMFQKLYEKGGVYASSCTKLWNRRIFQSRRFREGILHEDEELLNRALPHCHKVIYTDFVLYGYMVRSDSIVHSSFQPKHMDIFPIMEQRLLVLEDLELTELARRTQARMFQTAAWQYCLARKSGFDAQAQLLKQRILAGAKEKELPLVGQYRILHWLSGRFSPAIELYYFVRRFTGKP